MKKNVRDVRHRSCNDGGMTLIELMIVVVVIAILASVAFPSYQRFVIQSRRAEAQAILLDLQLKQEKYFASENQYADTAKLGVPSHAYYTFTVTPDVPGQQYTLNATVNPSSAQESDTNCSPLTLDQGGVKGPPGCWKE